MSFNLSAPYVITKSTEERYLKEILTLQKKNLPQNISAEERKEQGFLTCNHSFDLLSRMNVPYPHIIALHNDSVVGYTLVLLSDLKREIDVLVSMFDQLDQLNYNGKSLSESRYFVMGQVCISKEHRSQGLFLTLYEKMKEEMSDSFEYCITEIATENKRSLRAHEKVGFLPLLSYIDIQTDNSWELVIWNWE